MFCVREVALAKLADPPQAHPGGEPGLSEHAQPRADRGGVTVDRGGGGRIDDGVLPPAAAVA